MASLTPKEELALLVDSLIGEGVLNEQFRQLQMLQEGNNPGFVMKMISLFHDSVMNIFHHIENCLSHRKVDFHMVDMYVLRLKGSSATVGAEGMQLACTEFHDFCEATDKNGCLRALVSVRIAYNNLQPKFEKIYKLEKKIENGETSQQKGK